MLPAAQISEALQGLPRPAAKCRQLVLPRRATGQEKAHGEENRSVRRMR